MFAAAPLSCTNSTTLLLTAGSTTMETKLLSEAHQQKPVCVLVYYLRPASNVEGGDEAQSLGRHSGEKVPSLINARSSFVATQRLPPESSMTSSALHLRNLLRFV